MDKLTELANRALFEGNRTEVETLLTPRVQGRSSVPPSVLDVWLLASSVESEEARQNLLRHVRDSKQSPYAELANAILKREQEDQAEMEKLPKWQQFVVRRRKGLIRVLIAVGSLCMITILWSLINPGSDQLAVASQATATALAQTPTITPTATLLSSELTTPVAYPPFGTLRIVSVEYPTLRPVAQNNQLQSPPMESDFIAIQYEFVCGHSENAFCAAPPEAAVLLELASGQWVEDFGFTIRDSEMTGTGAVPSGSSTHGWLVYPVPQDQTPVALIIQTADEGSGVATYRLDLPMTD